MSEWFDNMNGSKPEDILQFEERETNGHDFCSAIINNLVVTDKSKQLVYDAVRYRINHPALGEQWYWKVLGIPLFDHFDIFYWAKKEA